MRWLRLCFLRLGRLRFLKCLGWRFELPGRLRLPLPIRFRLLDRGLRSGDVWQFGNPNRIDFDRIACGGIDVDRDRCDRIDRSDG